MLVTLGAVLVQGAISISASVDSALSIIPGLLLLVAFTWFTLTAFRVPADSHAPRPRLWLGGYLAAVLVLVAIQISHYVWLDSWLPYIDITMLATIALLTGMVAALATPAGRRRADWLFALALLAGVLVVLGAEPSVSMESMLLGVMLAILAVACALRGRVAARAG
jgi:hypothetical protein